MPAYCYSEGIHRILSLLQPLDGKDCELIVFDNSPDDEIGKVIRRWNSTSHLQVIYHRNQPASSAPVNWNALLDAARGEFCLLLHHDEFPLCNYFVRDLITAIRKDPGVDALILDCILVAPQGGRNRRHVPTWLRALVVKHFPHYLFRRNVIGPTSALVVRRSLYPRFDERLRWLIDVDAYVRLLKVTKRLRVCPKIQIGSMLERSDSLTTGLGSSIPQIEREERVYLEGVHHTTSLWLGPVRNEPILHSMLRACEAVCWNLMRGLTRIMAMFCTGPVPRSVVHLAMKAPPEP
jgi:glycosyltransferase involved in cell wall biosynthesis